MFQRAKTLNLHKLSSIRKLEAFHQIRKRLKLFQVKIHTRAIQLSRPVSLDLIWGASTSYYSEAVSYIRRGAHEAHGMGVLKLTLRIILKQPGLKQIWIFILSWSRGRLIILARPNSFTRSIMNPQGGQRPRVINRKWDKVEHQHWRKDKQVLNNILHTKTKVEYSRHPLQLWVKYNNLLQHL